MTAPDYFNVAAPLFLHVIHADVRTPSELVQVNGLNTISESCLTPTGQMLQNVARADAANYAVKNGPNKMHFNIPFGGAMQGCFIPSTPVPVGSLSTFHQAQVIR